jgi:hypothetical protein
MTANKTRLQKNYSWPPIIDAARAIVESYDTKVTLRQLSYRLISRGLIINKDPHYKRLSALTAEGRRDGSFPELADTTRRIEEWPWYADAIEAMHDAADSYRGDRMAGQPVTIYLGVEKRGQIAQLDQWFGDPYGIPILPLGGFASQSFINKVKADVAWRQQEFDRKAVFLYAGDFDASGITIDRVFNERTVDCFAHVQRIALNPSQIDEYRLERQEGKPGDNNTAAFVEQYGDAALFDPAHPYVTVNGKRKLLPVQVELDALDPNDLRQLFTDAIFGTDDDPGFWDKSAYEQAMTAEEEDREHAQLLADVADRFSVDELKQLLSGDDDENAS